MRITNKEKQAIIETAHKIFGSDTSVYLFGSRTDDNKKGGDIDLYIKSDKVIQNRLNKKINFLVTLKDKIGEQKIDAIISSKTKNLIEKIALKEGIKL
ncbi:MAG: nucleotidyltransferase domain-containing protein [bacterium]|nr:nucleotidyltransferase domain-containing protein [bacterium]